MGDGLIQIVGAVQVACGTGCGLQRIQLEESVVAPSHNALDVLPTHTLNLTESVFVLQLFLGQLALLALAAREGVSFCGQ